MAVPDPALFYRDLFGRLPDSEALHAGYGHFRPAGASCNLLRGDLFTGGYGAVLVVVFPGRSYNSMRAAGGLCSYMEKAGYREVTVCKDLAGLDRVVYGTYLG